MKIEANNLKEDKVVIVDQKEVEKQLKRVASIKPQRGHTIFQWNTKTGVITKASFEKINEVGYMQFKAGVKPRKRILIKKDCLYLSALNVKNAIKKLKREYERS